MRHGMRLIHMRRVRGRRHLAALPEIDGGAALDAEVKEAGGLHAVGAVVVAVDGFPACVARSDRARVWVLGFAAVPVQQATTTTGSTTIQYIFFVCG